MRYSVGSELGPRCHSRYIRTCCGMAAAMPWRTRATTHGRYRPKAQIRHGADRISAPARPLGNDRLMHAVPSETSGVTCRHREGRCSRCRPRHRQSPPSLAQAERLSHPKCPSMRSGDRPRSRRAATPIGQCAAEQCDELAPPHGAYPRQRSRDKYSRSGPSRAAESGHKLP
jgi:hypothetical protein